MKQLVSFSNFHIKQGAGLSTLMTALAIAYPIIGSAQSNVQSTEEVVVTASRISREGFTAPTPTTVVGTEEFKARAATNLTDILYDLPSSRPGVAVGVTGAGFSAINLRGVSSFNGGSRTLTLIDRKRVVGMNAFSQVDASVVPSALVAQLETITGGASAAWGSDAVAGVVNVVLKKRMQGFEGNIQYGESEKGDTKSKSASLAWGTEFADGRGQFMMAGEYSKAYDPATFADRDWGNQRNAFVSKTVNGVTYTNVPANGLQLLGATTGGVITTNSPSVRNIQFGPGGVPQVFVPTTDPSVGGGTYGVGNGGWVADKLPLSIPNERKSLYARGSFDLTQNITASVDLSHFTSDFGTDTPPTVNGNGVNSPGIVVTVNQSNPALQTLTGFLPGTNRTLLQTMQANNIPFITLGRIFPELGVYHNDTHEKVDRAVAAVDGTFGDTGKWSAYGTRGRSVLNIRGYNNVDTANFQAAISGCVTVSAFAAPGCVPGNPFGVGSLSPAFVKYVTGTLTQDITNTQTAGGVSVQGEPFSSWAGPVSLAGGLEYRKETFQIVVDPVSDRVSFPTGSFANGVTSGGGWLQSNQKSTPFSSYTIREVFSETVVPLLKNLPFAKSLDLNAAVRNTDYSTSGRVTSWKGGLTYSPTDSFLLRGTRSHDIRAPALAELYQGANLVNVNIPASGINVDPLRPGDTYTIAGTNKGNPNLKPEIGDTITVGATWSPTQIKGFSVSLDYFRILITNGIGGVGGTNIIDGCAGRNAFAGAGPNPDYCKLITRDTNPANFGAFTAGRIVGLDVSNINIGKRRTNGVDLDLSYRFSLASLVSGVPGTLTLRGLATYVNSDTTIALPQSGVVQESVGTNTQPRIRATLSTSYQNGPFTGNIQARYIDAMRYTDTPGATQFIDSSYNHIPSRTYLNLSGQYTIMDKTDKGGARIQVYGNINNLLDKDPPLVYGTAAAPNPTNNTGFYDLIGRAYVMGLRFAY